MFQECRHIKTNGLRCHAAALRGKPYCYFHMNLRRMHSPRLSESQHFDLPPIEDNSSVLLAVGQVIRTLNSPYADCRRAGLMLYALQIAAQLTARKEESAPAESVRTLYNSAEEPLDLSDALDNGAEILAPGKTICEPPQDCRNCPKQNSCPNYEEPEEDEEEQEEPESDEEEYVESEESEENEEGEEDERDGENEEDGDAEDSEPAGCPILDEVKGGKARTPTPATSPQKLVPGHGSIGC
jgi:hypothetical protein